MKIYEIEIKADEGDIVLLQGEGAVVLSTDQVDLMLDILAELRDEILTEKVNAE